MIKMKPNAHLILCELVGLMGIALIVHALVLFFIFPKYYSPLWPQHSDFYIPSAIAHGSLDWKEYLKYPRPVGMIFFYIIGHLGTRGAIGVVILITIINCAATAALFRRAADIPLRWPFFCSFVLYVYLLFSAPGFYIFYTHDAFAQFSYFLLLTGSVFFYRIHDVKLYMASAILLFLCVFAFLSKETYILSAGVIAFIWFLARRKSSLLGAILPLIGICIALAIDASVNYLYKSPFTGGVDPAYRINLNPESVLTEWYRYASEGLNFFSAIALGLILYFVWCNEKYSDRKLKFLGIICVVAGIVAWLPNALLPNHHFTGYSWNGAYLLFLPVLLLAPIICATKTRKNLFFIVVIIILTPLFSKGAYRNNQWDLQQEGIHRRLLTSIAKEASGLSDNALTLRILITGVDFPLGPFSRPNSLKEFKSLRRTHFDLLSYREANPDLHAGLSNNLTVVSPVGLDFSKYDYIWAFKSNGNIAFRATAAQGILFKGNFPPYIGDKEILLYPDLYDIFSKADASVTNAGQRYLKCGETLMKFNNMNLALKCLAQGVGITPKNPYLYFAMGQAQQSLGLQKAALTSYQKAIDFDDVDAPNPWFSSALSNLEAVISSREK